MNVGVSISVPIPAIGIDNHRRGTWTSSADGSFRCLAAPLVASATHPMAISEGNVITAPSSIVGVILVERTSPDRSDEAEPQFQSSVGSEACSRREGVDRDVTSGPCFQCAAARSDIELATAGRFGSGCLATVPSNPALVLPI